MKLFLLTQSVQLGYGTYDSCVVCAEDEQAAKNTHPQGETLKEVEYNYNWAKNADDVICKEIGLAHPSTFKGVIIASYNASKNKDNAE